MRRHADGPDHTGTLATTLFLRPRPQPAGSPNADSDSFFETKVRPVLAGTCVKCHGEKKASGGLRLDSREAMLTGGESGPAVVPGDPEGSLLVQAVRHADETLKMPPSKPLPAAAQDDLAAWVAAGAPWPKSAAGPADRRARRTGPSSRSGPSRPRGPDRLGLEPIDRFIAAGHRAKGLHPVAQADRRTLIRRATST